QAAALSAGELTDGGVGPVLQAHEAEQLVGGDGVGVVGGDVADELGDAPAGVVLPGLDDDSYAGAPLLGGARRVLAEDGDLAGRALPEALEDLHGRRLARTVGSEQRRDAAPLDVEVDPGEHPVG